jgi:ATP-dependent RNA helicase DDX18/HAS1
VNKLDLAKVGKAFGFAVPPRVNISIGGGKGGAGRSGVKRKREADEEEEEDNGSEDVAETAGMALRKESRGNERERRIERLGKRKVEKEVYRKGGRLAKKTSTHWSR